MSVSLGKIYSQSFSGTGIPNVFARSYVGFPIAGLIIWNNSPITFKVQYDQSASSAPLVIVPSNYAMGIMIPYWASIALVGDGTAPAAGNTLSFQLQDVAPGAPFRRRLAQPPGEAGRSRTSSSP